MRRASRLALGLIATVPLFLAVQWLRLIEYLFRMDAD